MGEDTALINEDMKVYVEEHREEISSAAEKNAEELIKNLLETLEYENIEFVFEPLF
jgi:hypothetical protein